jgi:hypothetical protein
MSPLIVETSFVAATMAEAAGKASSSAKASRFWEILFNRDTCRTEVPVGRLRSTSRDGLVSVTPCVIARPA